MPIIDNRNYRQLLTVAIAKRQKEIQDIVHNSTPLTKILKDSGRIQTKRAGGPELRIPIEFDRLAAQWFTGYDKIEITPKELLNSAVFNWSRVVSMFSLSGTELLYSMGEEQIIDTMSFYVRSAEKSIKEEWETSIVGDGTGQGGRQMVGLGGAVPIVANTGVYGGIDRGTVANWRTSSFAMSTDFTDIGTVWDTTTVRPVIERIALNRSRNGQYPDLWIFDAAAYTPVSASFVAHQRLATERSARLGYAAMAYHTPAGLVELVAAGGIGNVMPANTAFGLSTDDLAIYEFPNQSFVPFHDGDGMRPINQDAVAQGVVWSGQFVVENPLFQVRLRTTA